MTRGKQRITLVGAGNLARTLAYALRKAGYPIDEIATRRRNKQALSVASGVKTKFRLLDAAEFSATVIWLAVSDSAIRDCAEKLARRRSWKGKIVLHSSGALSSDELGALRMAGASVASVHPMMTFVAESRPSLEGIAWTLEGDPKAILAAKRIVASLGGVAFKINKEKKALYHAFGAFLSPLLVVLLDSASVVAQNAGLPRKDLSRFMEPIIGRTLKNIYAHVGEKGGIGKAFSGPLVRGDVKTIGRHLKVLRKTTAEGRLYRGLLEAALESKLPVKRRGAVRELLFSGR